MYNQGEFMNKRIRNGLLSLILAVLIAASTSVPSVAAPLLSPQARAVVGQVLRNTRNQFVTGNASYEAIERLFASLPVLPNDGTDTQAFGEALRALWRHGVHNGTIVLKETAEEGVYLLGALYDDLLRREKQLFDFLGTIEYNSLTGFFQGENGRGVFGIGFDYDAMQYMVRSSAQSWLKALGYNKFYDAAAPMLGIMIDTLRFPFSYDGQDWMVQMWKGNYFTAFHGAEIGLYQKPPERRAGHYNSSALDLPLSLKVYNGGNLLFSTGEHDSWWMAGFQYGNPRKNIFPADRLRVEGSIRFPEKGMLDAFYAAFNVLKPVGVTGEVDGLLFNFVWREIIS